MLTRRLRIMRLCFWAGIVTGVVSTALYIISKGNASQATYWYLGYFLIGYTYLISKKENFWQGAKRISNQSPLVKSCAIVFALAMLITLIMLLFGLPLSVHYGDRLIRSSVGSPS